MTRTFKKTIPEEVRTNATKPKTGGFISSFKSTTRKYKWKNGRNLLRLLPQAETSEFGSFCEYFKFGMFGGNVQGDFAFAGGGEVSKLIYEISKTLRAHPEHKFALKSKENATGVSITTQPKVAFLGFDFETPEDGLKIIDLPGTYAQKKDGKPSVEGAGTTITKSIYATNINGEIKYGDIFDIETGRVVAVEVQNVGTMYARYTPAIDAIFPITDTYETLLDEISGFDTFIDFKEIVEVKTILKQYLPAEMVAVLFQLND